MDRGTAEGGVTIAFVGDVHLGDVPAPELDGDVADVLASADLVVANLESPLTDRPIDVAGTIGLRSSPGGASVLAGWGVGAASLGNNHMFDCGPDGYEDTKRALDEACVPAFGAGLNLAEALEPLEFSRGGLRLHLLSFVEEDTRAVLADSDSHGCAPLTRELVEERIHASSEAADAVVVVVHWGYCDYRMPSPHQAKLVEAMFQAGATAVVGHHSHVVQGVRHRAQRLVAYSLGNFAFAEYSHGGHGARLTPDNLHGAILSVSVDAHGVSGCEVRHTQLGEGTISLDGSAASEDEFARRCRAVLPGRHESNWKRLVALRLLRRAAHWMNPASWSRIGRTQLAGGRIMLREIARRDN